MCEKPRETNNSTQLFFKKAKKMPWVIDIYIAIQAAMAFNPRKRIDLNEIANVIMPRPDRRTDTIFGLGEPGLEVLGILFDCKRIEKGMTDYHEYRFTRKADGKSIIGTVKI